jgi:hypothetical protein
MSLDIYSRDAAEYKFNPDQLEVSDELSQLLLQIECLLFTNKNEVLGSDQFGASLEEEIFTTNFSAGQLESKIANQISTYCPLAQKFNVGVNVQFYQLNDGAADGALLDITVDSKKFISFLF